MASRIAARLPGLATHAIAAALLALLLAAVGQPIFTDDLWWHLALGEARASTGMSLEQDPLLYTAAGPPSSSPWLSQVVLFEVFELLGFQGLRVLHVLGVAAVFVLAWSLLRRASGSATVASLLTMIFGVLSAYRVVQLRPHLVSLFATLVLYRLLIEDGRPASRARIALSAGLLWLWANAHSGFVLGPILLASAGAGLLLATPLRATALRAGDRARASSLAIAIVCGGISTLVNPGGLEPHLAYFAAGSETPNLLRVADEWLPIDLLAQPATHLPPTPLVWALVWALLAGLAIVSFRAARSWRTLETSPDPALVALAAASMVAMLTASRFTWLGIFPLLLLGQASRGWISRDSASARGWAGVLVGPALVIAFVRLGDWPMISRGLSTEWSHYATPYALGKYPGHATWVLRDAALQGNVYNDYTMGGFLGFWLAPGLKTFVNGSLNVPPRVMAANRAIREFRGLSPEQDLPGLLDQEQVDVFFGVRVAMVPETARPVFYTTTYLERSPDWIPIFRNVGSALYLRRNERNRDNLERIAAYYRRLDVPFDEERGFDAERVVREARPWAVRRGLVPRDYAGLARTSQGASPADRVNAQDRLAAVYAALGLYEQAVRLDRRTLRFDPTAEPTRRRLVWSLIHLDRRAEAMEAAEPLAAEDAHPLSRELAAAAAAYATLERGEEADAFVAGLPLLAPIEARWMATGLMPPEVRQR